MSEEELEHAMPLIIVLVVGALMGVVIGGLFIMM